MSAISILAMSTSAISSALFDELYNSNKFLSKLWYMFKKMLLKKVHCIILDDYFYNQLKLDVSDKTFIIVHPEKMLSMILNDNDRSNLKNLKIQSFDTYILIVSKKLKRIVNNLRFLHKKSEFIFVVSSYHLAKQLNISDKNIYSFMPDDDLFNTINTKNLDKLTITYIQTQRNIQKNNINLTQFSTWKQLNSLVSDISNNNITHNVTNTNINISKEILPVSETETDE